MSMPDYASLMMPMLQRISRMAGGISLSDLTSQVAREIGLSGAEASKLLPSGDVTEFELRLRWAQAYLENAGLAEVRDGALCITLAGREFVGQHHPPEGIAKDEDAGALQILGEQHARYRESLEAELLRRVQAMSPQLFEQLILDVLLAMGYGNSRLGLSQRLGRTGDGGLDGEIWPDELGLDRIYLQAKRYRPGHAVAVSEVRDFAGALEARHSERGVFVTTSEFPESARQFVEKLRARIALVDGAELAKLMLNHGIGVRLMRSYAVHHVDGDYFRE